MLERDLEEASGDFGLAFTWVHSALALKKGTQVKVAEKHLETLNKSAQLIQEIWAVLGNNLTDSLVQWNFL